MKKAQGCGQREDGKKEVRKKIASARWRQNMAKGYRVIHKATTSASRSKCLAATGKKEVDPTKRKDTSRIKILEATMSVITEMEGQIFRRTQGEDVKSLSQVKDFFASMETKSQDYPVSYISSLANFDQTYDLPNFDLLVGALSPQEESFSAAETCGELNSSPKSHAASFGDEEKPKRKGQFPTRTRERKCRRKLFSVSVKKEQDSEDTPEEEEGIPLNLPPDVKIKEEPCDDSYFQETTGTHFNILKRNSLPSLPFN